MNYNDKNKKHSVEVPVLHQIVKYLSFIVEFKKKKITPTRELGSHECVLI